MRISFRSGKQRKRRDKGERQAGGAEDFVFHGSGVRRSAVGIQNSVDGTKQVACRK